LDGIVAAYIESLIEIVAIKLIGDIDRVKPKGVREPGDVAQEKISSIVMMIF